MTTKDTIQSTTTYTLKIYQADHDDSPREWGNLGIMACEHPKYNLGDPDVSPSDIPKDAILVLPLYLYDHSGITMNTTGFSCPWDSGQVGYIYTTKDKLYECYADSVTVDSLDMDRLKKQLVQEVAIYDQFIRGDVYGYSLESDDGEMIDSCTGFYGTDWVDNGLFENLPKELVQHITDNDIDIEYGENVLTINTH